MKKQWLGCLSLSFGALTLIAAPILHAQGLSATANTPVQSPDVQFKALHSRIAALEARIRELEKKADDVKNNEDDDTKEKKLDKRFADIEREQKKLESEQESTQQQGSSHAKAPFVVYDKDDHQIFRVEMAPGNYPRMVLGNGVGAHVVVAADDQKHIAAVQLIDGTDPGGPPNALMEAGKVSRVKLQNKASGQSAALQIGDSSDYGGGLSFGFKGNTVAFLGGKSSGKGYLEIDDTDGLIMVEAGSLDAHKGYVLANPYQPSSDPHGDPSVLKGGRAH